METEFDPYIGEDLILDYEPIFLEDTGHYLALSETKKSYELRKMGIKNTEIKVARFFRSIIDNEIVTLNLNLDAYPELIEYNMDGDIVRSLISIKEMIEVFFANAPLSEYDEYYYDSFLKAFYNKEKVDIELIYDYHDVLCDLYEDYITYICDKKDQEEKTETKVLYINTASQESKRSK